MSAASKAPQPDSTRTYARATALAWASGCGEENPCWRDCWEAARDTIVEGALDEWEREAATTSAYWHATHREVT